MPPKKRKVREIKKVNEIFSESKEQEKEIESLIKKRARGESIQVSAVIPVSLFRQLKRDTYDQQKTESGLLEYIIEEHYAPYKITNREGNK